MFAVVTPKNLNPHLKDYLEKPEIKQISFDGEKFWKGNVQGKGLLGCLKKVYYPNFTYKKKKSTRKRIRKGSNCTEGIKVGDQLCDYIKSGYDKRKLKLGHSKALVAFWENQLGHTLQGGEIPTSISKFQNCFTKADIITEDKDKNLFMWEVKCGANAGKRQGEFYFKQQKVPSTRKNHWELQRYYTTEGLLENGLPLVGSQVINVYVMYDKKTKKNKVEVKRRKRPAWANH